MKNVIITSKQLNEVKKQLLEEKQLDNITLPNFIINSIKQNKTSLGEHPSFPPGDEKRFEEKILLKRFNEVGRAVAKIQGLEQYDKKYLIDKLTEYISRAITIEKEIRSELEEICYNYVCNQFDLTPGDLNIRCELKDKITPENEPNIEPQLLDETEFEDTDSMDELGKEIYKRRLIDSMVLGASVRMSEDYGSILSDIYKLNPALPELYYNIIALNDYLSFIKETKPSNYNLGGFVSVDLSSDEPAIYSEAVIFPVLVFETVKGVMELVSSHGLPENKQDAEYVIGKADFMLAENWDKRFGVGLYDLFTKNIQNKKLQTEIFNEIIDLPPVVFFKKMKEIFAGTKKGKMYINSLEKYVEREKGFGDIDAAIGKDSEGFNTFTLGGDAEGASSSGTDFYFEAADFELGEDKEGYFSIEELSEEATTLGNIGDFTYDVPAFGDKESLDHTNMIAKGQKEWNIRESKDFYDFEENQYVFDTIQEFLQDKSNGITKKRWGLIPAEQYKNALIEFMRYGQFMRFPTKYIEQWINIVTENTLSIQACTELAGHTQWFPYDDFCMGFNFDREGNNPELYEKYYNNYDECSKYLDEVGFYDWMILPDGTDAMSDYGMEPLYKLIMELEEQQTPEQKIVVINKILDVYHQRGDLASAFITGGSKSLSQISFNEKFQKNNKKPRLNESKRKSRLITESKFQGKTIINVDIQPEYENYITFNLTKWVNFINESSQTNDIVFLYNGRDTLGMVSEGDYQMWLIELGIDEDVVYNSTFYDKGYAFFRYCMDNSIDENNIVDLIKYMIRHDINDTRDIDTEMWDNYMQETKHSQQDVRDLLENADDMINIPDLMDFLNNYSNIVLLGGGINECLKEVEIALLSLDKSYNALSEFIY